MTIEKIMAMETITAMEEVFLRIRLEKVAWFKFILEGYDGLCMLTTVDHDRGIVRLLFHSSRTQEFFALLAALSPTLSPYCSQSS